MLSFLFTYSERVKTTVFPDQTAVAAIAPPEVFRSNPAVLLARSSSGSSTVKESPPWALSGTDQLKLNLTVSPLPAEALSNF